MSQRRSREASNASNRQGQNIIGADLSNQNIKNTSQLRNQQQNQYSYQSQKDQRFQQPVSIVQDARDSYLNYLNNNTNNTQLGQYQSQKVAKKLGSKQQPVFSVLGGAIVNSTVSQNTSIEDVVRDKMRKVANQTSTANDFKGKVNLPTPAATILGNLVGAASTALTSGGGRYSSANQSPVTVDRRKQGNESQNQRGLELITSKGPNFNAKGYKKQTSDQLGKVIEAQTLAQEYGLDNYSEQILSHSIKLGQGQEGGHQSLLKNEILRNTKTPAGLFSKQNSNLGQDDIQRLQEMLTKKQFQQQQAIQVSQNVRTGGGSVGDIIRNNRSKNYRKDGKNIGDLLQYKDYALEKNPTHNKTTKNALVQQLMEMSQSSDQMKGNMNMSVLSVQNQDNSIIDDNKEHRLLKNSYHPSFHKSDNQVRAKSQIKIPESLMLAFQNRTMGNQQYQIPHKEESAQKQDVSGFHITDLLDYSKTKNKYDASMNNKSMIVREDPNLSVLDQTVPKNEFVIKNYRLIQKKKREFFLPITTPTSPQRNQNPFQIPQAQSVQQSPIRVSNSILSPNTYHYSTKVSPTNQMPWNNQNSQLSQIKEEKHINQTQDQFITSSEINLQDPMNYRYQNLIGTKSQRANLTSKINQTIEIEDEAKEFDVENNLDIVEINFKDLLASWTGPIKNHETSKHQQKFTMQQQTSVQSDFQDLLQRDLSVSKIFNQGSSDSLDVENQMILKMKPKQEMYKEQMMGTSIEVKSKGNTIESKGGRGSVASTLNPNEDPYGHLKARNVFPEKAFEFQKQIEIQLQNPDTKAKVKMIIELTKDFLTHLEKQSLSADRLPLELFDDFLSENEVIRKRIEDRKRQGKSPLRAKSYYFLLDGTKEEADARVIEYNQEKKKFLIEFQSQGKTLQKHAGRLNLHFVDYESKDQIEQRRIQARNLRKDAQSKLLAERLFINELAKKYGYIRLPRKFKQQIKKKLVIDLNKYDKERVSLLVIQVEALFVFSVLKSIIYSQIGDPFISRIVAQYKIEEDFEGGNKEQATPYYALKAYEEQGQKLEKMLNRNDARLILQDYAIVGKKSFIDAIQFLISQNEEIVIKTPIFEFPISQNLIMYVLSQEEFKDKQVEKYKLKLKQYPVQMQNFIKSSRIIAKRFKETLEVRWTENIAKKVERIVDKEFDQNSRDISRKTLNPYVLKLFELIRLFQEKNLYDKLQQTLETYLQFLLQFAIRDEDFRRSAVYNQYYYEYFKALMSSVPMIKVEVKIKKQSVAAVEQRKDEKQDAAAAAQQKRQVVFNDQKNQPNVAPIRTVFEIQTKPLLGDVWLDFNGLIDLFVNSVSRIRRIDEMVIPQLKLKKNTLRQPDIEKDEKFEHLIRMINIIIDNMKAKPEKRVQKLQKYLVYLQMNFEILLFEMKKKSYEDQNSASEAESQDDHNHKHSSANQDKANQDHQNREQKLMQDAYKNIEISEDVYIQKFQELRNVYWDVQLSVENVYDFGIVALDCMSFKQLVKKHLDKLISTLSRYVITEFLGKMNNLFNQFEVIEKKSSEIVETIDEVIHLIDYIEKIQKPDDLMDELENFLDVIKNRKDFIDTLQLRLLDSDFQKYLNLFSYPNRLRTLLIRRKQNLENERNRLSEQMNKEKEKIMLKINSFRENLDFFKGQGLAQPAVPEVKLNESMKIVRKQSGMVSQATTKTATPVELSQNEQQMNLIIQSKNNQNTAQNKKIEEDEQNSQFVPAIIIEMSEKMDKLKQDLENTEQECDIINRREKLLNLRVTKFSTISGLQNEIKPFVNLWQIAANYTRVYEHWLYGSFYDLQSDQMEDSINEWWKQLTRIAKTHISTYTEPMSMLNHLVKELEKFKDYMPMITALRSKGLEKRHWQMLSKQLGFEIEPQSLTLQKLIERKMYEGNKLDIIKGVSEIAIKEYAIKTTLDALEHELRILEFQPIKYKETNSYIIKGIDDLITTFEESSIKILALKSNQYAKHFMDKILRVEKELKIIVDVLDEWVKAQKSWIYLEPIFQQQDIAKQMQNEAMKFQNLDSFYKREISNINIDPGVQRYCRKEGLIVQLQYVNKEFENITKGLSVYLESKREYFARFYFLSNEEIIEILGQMREPRNVQKFLNKIFEGIDYLAFLPNGEIVGIYSKEEEYIQLRNPIQATESAENWLKTLEHEMRESVKYVIHQSLVDVRMRDFESWVKQWQGQVVVVVMNIILTETLSDIFNNQQSYRLKDILKQIIFEIETLTKMIRSKLDYNARTTITSLLTNRVHARDTIKQMIESDVRYASDFLWKMKMKYEYKLQMQNRKGLQNTSQPSMRTSFNQDLPTDDNQNFEDKLQHKESMKSKTSHHSNKSQKSNKSNNSKKSHDSKKKNMNDSPMKDILHIQDREQELQQFKQQDVYTLNVSMIDALRPYGYEYLGNTQRIVITPLTDRCYSSLFMALHFNYGGSPEGPVGTGKTETTKDLSKCLAKQCFVFNCSSSLNFIAMTKFFKGLATSGAWSCFDEFNRIDLSVLSVISQIIIIIQGAIRENKTELMFEDTPIQFNIDCAIFITMNPQYIGRTELPDNLKSLFRPVAMIVPDSILISEILLYSFGFLQAKPLARKIVRAFNLAKQQLSNQIHYDFGLRSIKIVLQIAGLMKLKASGVIEPDFKIKEGKKKKKDDDGGTNQTRNNESSLSVGGQSTRRRRKKPSKSSYTKHSKDIIKKMSHIKKKPSESSLDSNQLVEYERALSVESEVFFNDTNQKFFRKDRIKNQTIDGEEENLSFKYDSSEDEMDIGREKQLQTHQVEYLRNLRSAQKFKSQRKRLVRGNIEKAMLKRMEFISEHKDEAKQTRKLMKVLGIDEEQAIEDEEKIEEFIVLRAINDTNVPKLHQTDTIIFRGITDDIFPNTLQAQVKYGSLRNLVEQVLFSKQLQVTNDVVQRILHLYDSVMIRHGVMIVGSTITGKTTSIQVLMDTLNKSRDNEVEERVQQYKLKKAKRLGITNQDSSFDENDLDKQNGVDLTSEEVKMIKAQCSNKGVVTYTINPKSLNMGQLMGTYDEISHDWNDGIMANVMRNCSTDISERRKWITFDGPIDPVWVENLNSVMDDNKKLTLSTGETIKMTGLMTIIIEAEDLSNCTPATISRCAMIYMKDDIIPLKAIINKWIKTLPDFLEDVAPEIDLLCNYFIPEILENFIHQTNLVIQLLISQLPQIYPVSQKWAIKNFCRIMNSLINDYRSDKFNANNAAAFTIFNDQNNEDAAAQLSSKMSTIMGKRAYHVQYADVDSRFQNALSFFLFSIVWAFGSILKINLRKEFDRQLRGKILCNTEEISTIAQLKSKIVKKQVNSGGTGKNKDQGIGYQPSAEFQEPEKPPYFLCPLQQTYTLFEVFFDLETNQWTHWDSIKNLQKTYTEEDSKFKKKGSFFNKFIPTIETIRLGYIIESNIICKNNLLIVGPTGSGKSWLTREVIFKQLPNISQKYKSSSIVFSNNSTADRIQYFIDSRLERRRKGVFGPPFTQKYVFFIDDLMMPFKDEYGIQSANELLRQWFDFQGWYDHKTLDFKKIEDIQFLSCVTVYESHKNAISTRNEWHWTYLGALNMDERHYVSLFSQILDNFVVNWPHQIQGVPITSVIKATLDIYAYFERHVKPTPSKFLYIYNTRHMFKIIYGMAEVEPTYLQSEFELAKLWIHEAWRTLCDRISDYADKKILFGKFNELARKYFKIGKNKLSKKIGYPFFCSFNKGQDGMYSEVEDMRETTQNLKKYLSEYNEINKKSKINIVLFEFLVEYLIKIHRLIKQPFSHGILIGIEGSGKHQLSQMACFLANYQMYQIKLEANYTQDDWYNDIKQMLLLAGVDYKEVVFHLKHNEIIKEDFLDDINTLVNNGEIQGIFTKEEYENIIQQSSMRGGTTGADKNNPANNQMILAEFSQKCRENLKILLNFTPTGANLRTRIRNYKSIVNCSTILWMDSWPQEGYKEVAETLLKEDEVVNRDIILEIAISVHLETIATAKNYFYETQHYLYITPHSFTDFINTYKDLFDQKRSSLKELQERYETGLERLKGTQDQVEKFQEQLENNSPMLIEKQIEIEKILEKLKEEHAKVGKRKEILMKEEQELNLQREQAERIKEECEFNLNKATPELYSAISALQNLSKQEINELKTLKNPPNAVKLLMEGVCLLMKVEPIKFKSKDGIGFHKDFWAAATSKYVLGNPKLQEILVNFDHTNLDSDVMIALEELIQNPEFVYENVARACKAARGISNIYINHLGLFLWIQALKNFYYIYQETQPKRDALYYAEKQKHEKEEQIKIKMQEFHELEENLERLKKEHQVKEAETRSLQKQIDEFSVKKERATKLLNGLGGEKQKWLVCNRMIAKKFLTIQGDVLLGAAFITYLSAFTQKFREQSVEKWESMIKNFGIRISDDFNFNRVFGDQIRIKEWNFNGLPSDSFSISNAIILENSQKQCICIDPQYQASKWIKIQEMSQSHQGMRHGQNSSDLKILTFNDVNFIQSFEFAMKFGKKVLIENVGQKIDLILYPILRKEFVFEGGTNSVNLFGHMVDIDKNFRLFITSEMRNPHFGPDISVMTNFVNFYVTLEGLEEQMLSIVISNQKSDLEEETIKMKKEALDYIRILKKLENDILDSLSNDIEHILSDEHLIETLNHSKKTGRQIAENLQKVNKASNKILKSRGIYTPAAYRAALLYFLVSDLSKIEVMYQYSLKWYIEIFTEEVKQKKHTDQDPLLDIIKNFTYTLYRNVCQSIFEKDKLLFTFLLAFRILEGEGCLNMKLFEFFIKGPQLKAYDSSADNMNKDNEDGSPDGNDDNDQDEDDEANGERNYKKEQEKQRKQKCPWITDQQWRALEKLSKIPPFHRPNIVEHILGNPEQWNQFIFAKESENIPFPGTYTEYDFEKEARIQNKTVQDTNFAAKSKQQPTMKKQGGGLKEIQEVVEDEDEEKIDDKIWGLDEENDGGDADHNANQSSEEDLEGSGMLGDTDKFQDDREQIADSMVLGVGEYHEFRLGSVRFEKEMITKKSQVLKDLLRFCIIRIFRPERVVREVQRFLGSVLDPRFMEPPVFNLASLYKETSCYSPILFILSPTINTLNELQILKYQIQSENVKIEYMPLGSNINEKVQSLILKSAMQGNWLLLENLHLVTDWIPTLEKFIHTMYKEDRREQMHGIDEHSDSELDTHRGGMDNGQSSLQQNINQFPELKGCRINSKFRLWLSSMPVDYFPVSFLQECTKITLQPAQGIRQNALKILNSISHEYLQKCPKRQGEFRKLFFALCIFHSVVVERQRFGPIGWSQPYYFSENDFLISSMQLQTQLSKVQNKDQPLPLELIRYLIGSLNYGGRIIKIQDEITLNAILQTFISEKTASEQNYRLTGQSKETGIYYIPGDGDLSQYKMHITKFPIQDRPEIFGLHENATIMRTTNEGKNLLERMFEFEFASKEIVKASDAAMLGDSNEDSNLQKYSTIKKRIQIIIEDLPELLDEELCKQKYPISYEHCINTLITKEVQRFNMLLQVIYVSLKNTLKALEGVIHINNVLEDIYRALTFEYVPKTWFKYSYPSFKSLSSFLSNLKERISFIREWLVERASPPLSYWLPGFFDQQSFLTMLLQQKARNEKISIDLLHIEYIVMPKAFVVNSKQDKPDDGCYIYGLWIEGAQWSDQYSQLADSDSRELYQEMPFIHLKVINQLEYEKQYHNKTYYQCPLYLVSLRERLDSEFTQGLVTQIPLPIGNNSYPEFWIKRGTALLCQKEE